MMTTEVPQSLYERVMGKNPSYRKGARLPVENVSWFDAIKMANKLRCIGGRDTCYLINGTSVELKTGCTGWRLPPKRSGSMQPVVVRISSTREATTWKRVAWYSGNSKGPIL